MAKILLASATLSQLVAYASVSLGLEVPDSPKPTKASILALISSSGTSATEIDIPDEEFAASNKKPLTADDVKGRTMVKINIPMQENVAGGSDAVPVGVNGVVARIMRGVDVEVPAEYVEVLSNANKIIFDRGPNSELINPRFVPIYPFSIIAILS